MSPARHMAAPASGALLLFLPKCPMCVLAILQVLGIHTALAAGLLYPVGLAVVAAASLLLAAQAFQRRAWAPLALCLSGTCLLIVGKLYFRSAWVPAGGVLLLAASVLWTALCRASCPPRCAHR